MPQDDNNPWRESAEQGFGDDRDRPQEEKRKSTMGCLLWGCLIVVVVGVVLMIAAGVGTYYFVKGQIEQYTDEAPMNLPVIELPEEEMAALQARVDAFEARVNAEDAAADDNPEDAPAEDGPANDDPLELTLTADDLNALVASNPDLKGRVFLTIEEGLISGQVSMPTGALPMAGGRFFNATAKFDVSFANGDLSVKLVDATVKGEPLPKAFLDAMANEDLAEDIEQEAEVKPILQRIESLRVEGDRIVLTARSATGVEGDEETEGDGGAGGDGAVSRSPASAEEAAPAVAR